MKWPEACKLIDRIKAERPELTVDHHGTGDDHYALRLSCLMKGSEGDSVLPFHLVPGSVGTIYGVKGWDEYRRSHPEPFCRPEDSYHTDATGREVDHRGHPVSRDTPPPAPQTTAQEMLQRIIALNRSDPDWWRDQTKINELAAAWGVRAKAHGVMADCEQQEVARLSGDVHASVLIARTGSGLYASGVLARWGKGGACMEPSVGGVPYDTEHEARRAAMKELIETLQAGRHAAQDQQRMLLLAAVKEKDRDRGLFG